MRESNASRGCVIFVGNLPGDVREREVEDLFIKVDVLLDHCKIVPLIIYCINGMASIRGSCA